MTTRTTCVRSAIVPMASAAEAIVLSSDGNTTEEDEEPHPKRHCPLAQMQSIMADRFDERAARVALKVEDGDVARALGRLLDSTPTPSSISSNAGLSSASSGDSGASPAVLARRPLRVPASSGALECPAAGNPAAGTIAMRLRGTSPRHVLY